MGTDTTYHSSNMDADYLSEELSAEVLKRLKSYVGDGTAVNEAVVTVPAKFTVNQKTATMKAASAADLEELATAEQKVASTASTLGVSQEQLTAQIGTIVSLSVHNG